MKRLLIVLTIIVFGLLSACADMDMDPMDDPIDISFDDKVYFSWNTMTFTDLSEYDILHQVGTPEIDYFIAYQNSGQEDLSDNQLDAYRRTIQSIVTLDQTTSFTISNLTVYTSGEFASYLEDNDLDVSAIELLTFAALQEQVEEREFRTVNLTKKEYIELRLERALTQEEVNGMNLLQELYIQLKAVHHSNFMISSGTFDQFLEEVDQELGTVFTIEEQTALEDAFAILTLLHSEQ